jgi:hypothetical protein
MKVELCLKIWFFHFYREVDCRRLQRTVDTHCPEAGRFSERYNITRKGVTDQLHSLKFCVIVLQ